MARTDLISKTALLRHLDMAMECKDCPRNADKELYKCVNNPTSELCTCADIAHICNTITDFATYADVQPVRRGRWIECCNELDKKCSCCDKVHGTIYEREPYCPNCGADMRDSD